MMNLSINPKTDIADAIRPVMLKVQADGFSVLEITGAQPSPT